MTMPVNRRQLLASAGALTASALASGKPATAAVPKGAKSALASKPVVIGHRGCPALRPENTLAAFDKAIADGADYLEFDIVVSKDNALVIRHGSEMSDSTDVALRPEFADRKTTKTINDQPWTGWFTEDFTLAELKTLRGRHPAGMLRPDVQAYNGHFEIPTLAELIEFTATRAATLGRTIGLVPEIKFSSFYRERGQPIEDAMLSLLAAHEYTRRAPVEVFSFENANLRYLRSRIGESDNIRLTQLIAPLHLVPGDIRAAGGTTTYGDLVNAKGLADLARYADGISAEMQILFPRDADDRLTRPSAIIAHARDAGLMVRAWTFRPENRYLAADFRNGAGDDQRNERGSVAEMARFLTEGVDGLITDDPALGRKAVAHLQS